MDLKMQTGLKLRRQIMNVNEQSDTVLSFITTESFSRNELWIKNPEIC